MLHVTCICRIWKVLVFVVWCLRDAYELVWWLATCESCLGYIFKSHVAFWEHADSGFGHILKLHVASWEPSENLLNVLGNVVECSNMILEMT